MMSAIGPTRMMAWWRVLDHVLQVRPALGRLRQHVGGEVLNPHGERGVGAEIVDLAFGERLEVANLDLGQEAGDLGGVVIGGDADIVHL